MSETKTRRSAESVPRCLGKPSPDEELLMNETKDEPTVQMSVRIPAELARALEQAAREDDRTLSAQLRRIIRQHVEGRVLDDPA